MFEAGHYDQNSVMQYSYDSFVDSEMASFSLLDANLPFDADDSSYMGGVAASDEDINKCNRLYNQSCEESEFLYWFIGIHDE